MRLIRWMGVYAASGEPRVAVANTVALVIVSNQPFYPLYLYFIVGSAAWVSLLTLITTPFFFAVPAVARRSSVAGRALIILAGTGNTLLCMKLIGEASGVALFLLPCILLGTTLFRTNERTLMAICTALPMAVFLLLHGRLGAPLATFSAEEYASMVTLHAVSVGSLTAFIGYMLTNIFRSSDADP